MYQQEQKLQNMQQSSFFYQFLKKLIQIAISFSVFSVLFLHPSWPLFHSFISHLSTFTSHVSSLATDKNYIFLLCNGILVFIAKYSSHTVDTHPPALPETSPDNDLIYKAYRQSMQSSMENSILVEDVVATNEDENENRTEINEVMQEEDVEGKHIQYQATDRTVKEEEDDATSNDEDKVYMKKNFECWSYEEQQDDDEAEAEAEAETEEAEIEEDEQEQEQEKGEDEAIARMSTEELNRKFDDFIRKMKEELRIEAQQLLIVV